MRHTVRVDHQLIEAMQEREHHLAQAQRLAAIGSWEWDIGADRVTWSDELYRIFGVRTEELEPTYAGVLSRVHPDDRCLLQDMVTRGLNTLAPWVHGHRVVRPNGEVRAVESRGEVVADADGHPVRMHGILQDRTDAPPSLDAALLRYTRELIAVLDAGWTILSSTAATDGAFGRTRSLRGTNFFDLVHPDDHDELRRRLETPLAPAGSDRFGLRVAHLDGTWRHAEAVCSDIVEQTGQGVTVINLRDITEWHAAEQRLIDAQCHDPLTGLLSRSVFVNQAERALALARRVGWTTVIFSLDVDHFHRINDVHGHERGDEVLVTLATRLLASLRQHDTIGHDEPMMTRVGADGFLLMCENVRDDATAALIAKRLLEAVSVPIGLPTGEVTPAASIGISTNAGDSPAQQMILDAEAAQRHAKKLGGARHQFFSAELHASEATASALVEALHHALEADEFRLFYQPKISLATDRIVGVEALVRWEHPDRGLLAPGEFIPAAELNGLVVPIGAWVMREACRQVAQWRRDFPKADLGVAINVSAQQFRSELAPTVREAIERAGIHPGAVCLEMTETTVMDDIGDTVRILHELKALGLTISIDDFGTGYSSLEYLHRMPIDEVKIDRSFVAGLGTDPADTAIVASVISLAHAMERDVVAEGVESLEQLDRLRSLGCDLAQGYFIARPMPADSFEQRLSADAAGHEPAYSTSSGALASVVTETVLVVDDSADIRMLATMSLTAAGFTVEQAANGSDAIAAAKRLRPDCVLLDVSMPGINGIEVCRMLREDDSTMNCTIVMLTTRADAADKAEAFLVGADEYIVKPFAPRDLVARVRAAVRRRDPASGPTVDAARIGGRR